MHCHIPRNEEQILPKLRDSNKNICMLYCCRPLLIRITNLNGSLKKKDIVRNQKNLPSTQVTMAWCRTRRQPAKGEDSQQQVDHSMKQDIFDKVHPHT